VVNRAPVSRPDPGGTIGMPFVSKSVHPDKGFIGVASQFHPVQRMLNCAKLVEKPAWALVVGIAITYFSGFLSPLFPQMTVDVLQWGSPLPYLHRVVTFPGPAFVDWWTALLDAVIWTVLAYIVLYFAWPKGSEEKCAT